MEESKEKQNEANILQSFLQFSEFEQEYRKTGLTLGKGSEGKVYEYQQVQTREFFAIKKLILTTEESQIKLIQQLQTLTNIKDSSNSGIVNFFGYTIKTQSLEQKNYSQKSKKYYLIFEKCLYSLYDFINNAKARQCVMNVAQIDKLEEMKHRIIKDLLKLLQNLYENKISHRDIKPSNIMFTYDGSLVLIDLGFCKKFGEIEENAYSYVGSPCYIAPEIETMFQDSEQNGEKGYSPIKADIFSFGIVIFQLWQMKFPIQKPNNISQYQSLSKWDQENAIPIQAPKDLEDLVKKMIKRSEVDRISIEEILVHPYASLKIVEDIEFVIL